MVSYLTKYRDLIKNIRRLEAKAERLERRKTHLAETVKGSAAAFPYYPGNIRVRAQDDIDETLRCYMLLIANLKLKRDAMLKVILNLLKRVTDQEIRLYIELYYLNGYSYFQVAELTGGAGDGTTEMKKVRRYLRALNTFPCVPQ